MYFMRKSRHSLAEGVCLCILCSNLRPHWQVMQYLDVDYVLIMFGGVIGYSGDDINKFLWMVRIAEVR